MNDAGPRWPWDFLKLDPYEADERAVKRAYAKLLKDNRPDDDPDAFMTLRKARDQALEELGWGHWDQKPAEADEGGWDYDGDLDEFGDSDWLLGNKPATVWVEDRDAGTAIGIDRARVFTADLGKSRDLFIQSFKEYATDPDGWNAEQANALVEAATHLLGSGSDLPPAVEERQPDRYARSLGYLHWISWRTTLREAPEQSSLVDSFLAVSEAAVMHYGHEAMPCACLAPSVRAFRYDGPSDDYDAIRPVLDVWRDAPNSVTAATFRSMFAAVSANYGAFELRGFPESGSPPELLLGAVACLIAQMSPGDRREASIREAVEFVTAAADRCGVPLPPWITLASVANDFLTSRCTPGIWRVAQEPKVQKALYSALDWYNGNRIAKDVTPDVIAELLEPVARTRRQVAGLPSDDARECEIDEDDCDFHHELINALGLMDPTDSERLRDLFCLSLGLFGIAEDTDDLDDVDADPVGWVYSALLTLLDADAPRKREDWDYLLNDPSVSDIDSAMDLERWLRDAVLSRAGYREQVIRPIPGFGAEQALLTKDRFGWGEPKSMASWDPDEREAMLALFDQTRRRHFSKNGGARPPPSERGHQEISWGDQSDNRLDAEKPQEDNEVSEKTERIVKYFVWAAVVLLLVHLIRLFTGG